MKDKTKTKSKSKTKTSKKKHASHFKDMAKKISSAWKKYDGKLTYAQFTKKMWKENK
jgi:hypothetical protein